MRFFDRIKAKIIGRKANSGDPPSGLKNLLDLDIGQVDPSTNALSKFEKVVATWDREQARMALAVLCEMTLGDRGPLESIFGKGAKSQDAIRHIKMGHLRVLMSTVEEITGVSFEEHENKKY